MAVRPQRRDAARNRARLIAVAADAFREDGLGVSVNAIADAAGVNIATLYRHFPAKDDLVSAVLEELLTPLVAARDSALERDGSLATFLHEAARMQAAYQGLIDAQLYQPLSGRCANSCEIRPRRSSPRSPSAPTPTGRCARISTPRIC